MIGKKILVISCSIFMLLLTTQAQVDENKQEKLTLSLAEAKEYALSYNRKIQMSSLAIQKANQAKWQALSSMLPHVNATAGYTNFMGYEMALDLGGGSVMDGVSALVDPLYQVHGITMPDLSTSSSSSSKIPMNPNGDLTLQASIAVSGVQIVATQLSKTAIAMSEINKSISELDVKASVVNTYYSVLIAEESKHIIENSRDNVMKLYESTNNLYQVGMAEQTDVYLLSVQLGTIENSIRFTERNIELAYNSLRLMLGSDSAEIELTQTLNDFLGQGEPFTTISTPFEVEQNYNVQLLNQSIDMSKKQVSMRKWEYGPTLSAFYQYNTKTYFGLDEGFNMTPPNTVGATLSIPIFSSGERLSKVRQAKFDLQTAELTKQDAVEGLLVQEKQLRFNLKSAIETYEVQKKNIALYERIFDKTAEKYKLGTISSTELTTVNNNMLQAQSSYINALLEMFNAQTNLQKLLNTL